MDKRFKFYSIVAMTMLWLTACGTRAVRTPQTEQTAPGTFTYQTLLGKSVEDPVVADFILSHHCSSTNQFQVCKDAGMALWINDSQMVETVYLYSGSTDGFKRYRGGLPFGLTFYDPMWRVEKKLSQLEADDPVRTTGGSGLPDEGSSSDHMHYWAVYKRFNIVVIYDTPFADEDAYIYAVLVNS